MRKLLARFGAFLVARYGEPVAPPAPIALPPAPVERYWVGLTVAEDVTEDEAAAAYAGLQHTISEGQPVTGHAEWCHGSAVVKTFRIV